MHLPPIALLLSDKIYPTSIGQLRVIDNHYDFNGLYLTSTKLSIPTTDGAYTAGEADRDADDPAVPAGKHVRQHSRRSCQGVHRGVETVRTGTFVDDVSFR